MVRMNILESTAERTRHDSSSSIFDVVAFSFGASSSFRHQHNTSWLFGFEDCSDLLISDQIRIQRSISSLSDPTLANALGGAK